MPWLWKPRHTNTVFQQACHLQSSCSPTAQAQSWLESGHFLPRAACSIRRAAFQGRRAAAPWAQLPAHQAQLLGDLIMAQVPQTKLGSPGLLLAWFQFKRQTSAHITWKSLQLTSLLSPTKSYCIMKQSVDCKAVSNSTVLPPSIWEHCIVC